MLWCGTIVKNLKPFGKSILSLILYIITIPATNCKKIWFYFLKKKLGQRIGARDQKMGKFSAICNFGMIASINLKFFKNVLGYNENVLYKFGFYSISVPCARANSLIWPKMPQKSGTFWPQIKEFYIKT